MKYQSSFKKNRILCWFLIVGFWCLIVTASLLVSQGSAYAQVTLAWDASAEAAGYKIYYGTTSNNYTFVVDVGNDLTYTFTDLPDGNTYYFAATAYDASYLESDYSTEVSYVTTGQTEIIWRNASTGENAVWYMDGTTIVSSASLPTVNDTNWQIVGTGDFNGDGKKDILWRNASTGANYVWYMDGITYQGSGQLFTIPAPWQIVSTGDFNGDGRSDILWRNPTTGDNWVWFMNGTTFAGNAQFFTIPAPWQIVSTGDFNGDGRSDILWRNPTTGAIYVWYMDGVTYQGGTQLFTVSAPWEIVGH
jgi:hypothetical protein